MLPQQQDILWSFVTVLFTLFSIYVLGNVIRQCFVHRGANLKAWGSVFLAGVVVNIWITSRMFSLNQQEQLQFIVWQVLAVLGLLLVWGVFFKTSKIEAQSPPIIRAAFFYITVSILLAGYTNWLPQQRSDPPGPDIVITDGITVEEFVEMGKEIVLSAEYKPGTKSIGKGQCPLCHTFEPGDNIGRCPNLFGVEQRSHERIQEERYLNEPIKIGEKDGATGIIKGKPEMVPVAYRREGFPGMTGEDYLRESMICPSCYVVKGYGKAGDTKSPMPVISKPPISLSPVEMNAVIAWLQAKDTPGDYSRVSVPLPKGEKGPEPPGPVAAPIAGERVTEMITSLGCPLCHTIPGIEGANGELGPVLHEKINAPKRLKDPAYQGKAKTPREYVRESIVNPGAYVVFNEKTGEHYPDGLMPQDFSSKLSDQALDQIVDFISNTEPEKDS